MSESIFDEVVPSQEEQEASPPQPQFSLPQEVMEFVGEGKKYRTVEDALKSIPYAQKHIEKLEVDWKSAQDELSRRKTAEELLEEIKTQGVQKPETVQNVPVDVEKVVEAVLSKKEQTRITNENAGKVVQAFKEKYGDKGKEMFEALANEVGVPIQALNTLAANSPQVVFKLAGFENKQDIPSKQHSSVKTEAFIGTPPQTGLSAKVKSGATTKDLVNAWKAAGEIVKQKS